MYLCTVYQTASSTKIGAALLMSIYSMPDTVHGAQGTLARRVGEIAGYTRRERVHLNLKDFTSLYLCFLTLVGRTSKRQPLERASISSRQTVRAKV